MKTRLAIVLAMALIATMATPLGSVAVGAEGDVGHRDQHFSGTGTAVTGAKPESKLWFNDGRWWASMWDESQGDNFIYRRDPATQEWSNTGVAIDTRSGTRSDTLWDGNKLYVASHGFTNTPASGFPARLYRYSYDAASATYSLDAGYPVAINNYKTETLTLDKDSTGKLWATWVQDNTVYVNRTVGDDRTWGTPFALPVSDSSGLHADDISSVIAFGDKIGVMWSNQTAPAMYFAVHVDGDSPTTWQTTETAIGGTANADDHINLKADDKGRVYAAMKTEQTNSAAPLATLGVREPTTGTWSRHTFGRKQDHHTRPIVVLDQQHAVVHMFATSEEAGGTIFQKTAPMDAISFPEGQGTPFVRDGASADMNDATSTKQPVNATSGIAVMASNESTRHYWHNLASLGPAPLSADFVGTPTSGAPPLAVGFTDKSTGKPTSWKWDFGDGTSSTEQHPSHTYAASGTYTVTLKVTDSEGGTETKMRTDYISVSSTAPTATLSVSPIDDAYVRSLSPDTNYGTAGTLRVKHGGSTGEYYTSYLKFNVSGLSGPVTSARLRLYVLDPAANGGTVHSISDNSWTESALTWRNAPPIEAPALVGLGPVSLDTWVEVELPADTFANGDGTYTLAIKSPSQSGGTAWYGSKDGTQSPQLILSSG